METYTELKEFVENPNFQAQRQNTIHHLTDDMIDAPISDLIRGFNALPYCFTLQCCFGHFVYTGQDNDHNLEPLPSDSDIDNVKYRIAYIAFCIMNSAPGKGLFSSLKEVTAVDPEYIQFCCAEWFWKRQVNSFALQVEPDRFKNQDTAIVDYKEALHIEKVRNDFFKQLYKVLKNAKEGKIR